MSITRLNPDHNSNETAQANVANARTLIYAWSPPNNTRYILGDPSVERQATLRPGEFFPVIKLLQSGGAELPGDSLIVFAARSAKAERRTELQAIRYHVFRDLTTAEQRNRDYRGSVLTQLEGRVHVKEGNFLEVYLESSAVLSPSQAGVTFELPVNERPN